MRIEHKIDDPHFTICAEITGCIDFIRHEA